MNKTYFFVGIVLCTLPSCRKPSIKKEFKTLQNEVQDRLEKTITYSMNCLYMQDDMYTNGLSKDRAVGIALEHNPMLHAHFQNIGIAKSDVVTAGLFTNPHIESIFNIPKSSLNQKTKVEINTYARLSDAWLVPLSKRVAEDVLHIVTQEILQTILDVTYEVSVAYNECLAAYTHYKVAKETVQLFKTMHDMFAYYYTYGYGNELVLVNSEIALHAMQAELIEFHAQAKQASLALKKSMGLEPTKEFIALTDTLTKNMIVPQEDKLELYALEYNPRIAIFQLQKMQYEHQIALEKGKLFQDIDLGFSYEKDFDGTSGWGPALNISLPVFNQNQGEIMRARYLHTQACNMMHAAELEIKTEIRSVYEGITAVTRELQIYQNKIMPLYARAKEWIQYYNARMQLNHFVILETQKSLYEYQIKYAGISKQLHNYYAQLEHAVGKRLFI